MHFLLTMVLVLIPIGIAFLVVAAGRPARSGTRRTPFVAGACILGSAVAIILGLRFFQPTVCETLDGTWRSGTNACAHEWGGNGSNDPSIGGRDIYPWT